MHRTTFNVAAIAFALAASALTLTASTRAEPPKTPDDGNVTQFRFEDDLIRGDLARPNGEVLRVRKRHGADSLVRVREHFIDRLLRSAEDL